MKTLNFIFLGCMVAFGNAQSNPAENSVSVASLFVEAIKNENYTQVEKLLEEGTVSVNQHFNGKPFIIYACIHNKPEMVRLLFSNGADLGIKCEDGFWPEDHAIANKSFHALSELIIIKA